MALSRPSLFIRPILLSAAARRGQPFRCRSTHPKNKKTNLDLSGTGFFTSGLVLSLVGLIGAKQLTKEEIKSPPKKRVLSHGEMRFRQFASLEVNGEVVMTPRDLLESLVQDGPRPRIRSRLITVQEANKLSHQTPLITKYSSVHKSRDPKFLREVGDGGVIKFSEYLFMLSIMTRPKSGLRIAFDLMDLSKGDSILKEEFEMFCMVATKTKEDPNKKLESDTTLEVHFFGRDGRHQLTFDEFSAFTRGLQREVLLTEFMEFSRGLDKISERDFAELLLRYTDLSDEDQNQYFNHLETRLSKMSSDRPGISFTELEQFFVLLNNISDFSYVFRLYSKQGSPLSKKEFARAAKISMNNGEELSTHLIDVVFALFDKAGDSKLSYEEFFVVLKNRLHRQVRRSMKPHGWEAFKTCVRDEIKIQNSQPK